MAASVQHTRGDGAILFRSKLAFVSLAVFLAASVCLIDQASAQNKSPPKTSLPQTFQIDRNGVLILVRSTLTALDQANKTGNYSVFRDLGAPRFASANSVERLSEEYANLRRDKVDLSGVLVLEPELTDPVELNEDGMLRISGFFPSVPMQLNFTLMFQPVEGQWRLFGISTNIVGSGPKAPMSPSQTPAKKS